MSLPDPSGPDDLDVDSSPGFEAAWGRAKPIIVAVLALLVFGGLAGLFGRGPVSQGAGAVEGGRVEWERFARRQAAGKLTIDLAPAETSIRTLTVDKALLDAMTITSVQPQPIGEETTQDGVAYRVAVGMEGGRVTVGVEHSRAGLHRGSLRIDGAQAPITTMVWP